MNLHILNLNLLTVDERDDLCFLVVKMVLGDSTDFESTAREMKKQHTTCLLSHQQLYGVAQHLYQDVQQQSLFRDSPGARPALMYFRKWSFDEDTDIMDVWHVWEANAGESIEDKAPRVSTFRGTLETARFC